MTYTVDKGPFADSQRNATNFCHNLFLFYTIGQCVEKMIAIEKQMCELEHDEQLLEAKKAELMSYQSSLMLTAYMFDESDEIST
mgnify:CR=1 FL=1|tara:strand:- start:363 stop:614 length:252 start_codon:yes stop_codon:yes gene_type:complete